MAAHRQRIYFTGWVRFIFLLSSTIVSVVVLAHQYLCVHNKPILAKNETHLSQAHSLDFLALI